jgi:hypothetical protein
VVADPVEKKRPLAQVNDVDGRGSRRMSNLGLRACTATRNLCTVTSFYTVMNVEGFSLLQVVKEVKRRSKRDSLFRISVASSIDLTRPTTT